MAQYFANFAYDYNYKTSVIFSLGLGLFDLIVISLAWFPITNDYNKKVAEKEREAKVVTYDEFGCDEYGLNVDRQPCRGLDPTIERGYGCEDEDGTPC